MTTIDAPAKPVAKRAKPATVDLITGHCLNEHHDSCRGSGPNGAGSAWYCICDCHVEQPTCRDCGARGVEVTLEGTCVDVEGCATTQQIRTASNPVHQTIREALSHAAQAVLIKAEQDAAKRARERAAAPPPPKGDRSVNGAAAQPRPAREARSAPTPQRCHDGCGGMTKGGRFTPGCDAKLKGRLIRDAEAGSVEAIAEMIARGWLKRTYPAAVREKAERLVDAAGIDGLIQRQVEKRYALAPGTNA